MREFFVFLFAIGSTFGYEFKTTWYTTKVDHFGYANNDTFQMRVLYNDDHFDVNNPGPIFFYAGNEGDVEMFAQNTGLMWDWAEEFKALLIFAEHRFYGKSMPYGKKSLSKVQYYGYLTVEQAMADFADYLTNVKKTWPGTANSKVVAFGGSYGGMLAAWMRLRYPWIIDAALAASAPVIQFQDLVPCNAYNQVLTRAFSVNGENCANNIRKSWPIIKQWATTEQGAAKVRDTFKICEPLAPSNYTALFDWLTETYSNMAMMNYPYGTNFIKKVPGHIVKVACSYLNQSFDSDELLLSAVHRAVSVFHNFTGSEQCFKLSEADGDFGGDAWGMQTCNEMVMPMCSDGKTDMLYDAPFNFTSYRENCESKYQMTPDLYKAQMSFGGDQIASASQIIFSNGDVDPWSGGGILKELGPSLPIIMIKGGAHHYDLRPVSDQDTPEVISARNVEKEFIRKWIGSP